MDLKWALCLRMKVLNLCRTVCQALLGQKYGYRPFPPTIDADEFSAIRDQLAAAADEEDADTDQQASLALLDTWFKRNTNIIPPVYTLQPISSVLPDYALDSVINPFQLIPTDVATFPVFHV